MPALQELVEKDKQANNGIPSDLRKLLALQDLTSDQQHMGIDQALKSPMNPPTVSQSLQDRAKQILQARMSQAQQNNAIAQQQQQQMIDQGRPGPVPAGVSQPDRQPEGIDQLESNVGESYANGGIVAFTTGDQVIDPMLGTVQNSAPPSKDDDLTLLERFGIFNPENRRARERAEAELRRRAEAGLKKGDIERGRLPDPRSAQVRIPDAVTQLNEAAEQAEAERAAPAPNKRATKSTSKPNIPNLPALPPELPTPAAGSPRDVMGKDMALDPEAEMNRILAAREKLVGAPDTSQHQALIEELRGQREKLQKKPEKGLESLMEYFGEIAAGPTVGKSGKAGAQAAERLRLRELEKEKQANALSERMIDAAQKQQDAIYGYKKEGFALSEGERAKIFERRFQSAKAAGESDDRAKQLAQQATLEYAKIAATLEAARIGASTRQGQMIDIAQALIKDDPTGKLTLQAALQRAAQLIGTVQTGAQEVRSRADYQKAKKEIEALYPLYMRQGDTKAAIETRKAYDNAIAENEALYGGVSGAGLNSLPATKAGVKILSIEPSPK
jgi:hypothetical protein